MSFRNRGAYNMGLLDKLATAVRGGTREVLEQAVDANGLRILAQEIHECETSVRAARQDLCRIAAERIQMRREADQLHASMKEKERQAGVALDQGEEALAREAAQWIAEREPLLSDLRRKQHHLESQETGLKQRLQTVIEQIAAYRRELRMVQATANAQSATRQITCHAGRLPDQLDEIQVSLQRIKGRQQNLSDRLEAAEVIERELGDGSLEARLDAMDSDSRPGSTEAVLDRIRNRQARGGCPSG
ncbi:MAG: PspA/IM30 family protein [Gammaproteobacteria bacterium]|nr:PspA/IM30 family protein [Gammaproteobacteria bacterium]